MATLVDTQANDPNSGGWLGFTNLKDVVSTISPYLVAYGVGTASKDNPTSTQPVQPVSSGTVNAATTQNIGITSTLTNPVILGGAAFVALLYIAHKVLK